jgi:hypothetical protein
VANLVVLGRTMFVSAHDATLVDVLLLYSIGAGVGAALVLARLYRAIPLVRHRRKGAGGITYDVQTRLGTGKWVPLKAKTTGKPGSGFTDNTVDAIVLFHQENGQWKLWSEDVLGIDVTP